MHWIDNFYNSFACKLRCPAHEPPGVLHFVGVPKPTEMFISATRRSQLLNR